MPRMPSAPRKLKPPANPHIGTQHKPADARASKVVAADTGMVCDCGLTDSDDCERRTGCRMWRDFSVVPYGRVFGNREEECDTLS